MPTSHDIRQQFLDYFVQRQGHTFVPSSPVVPHDDPTLLFANAGMNQFKDVFLGAGSRDYSRAVNTQKCIRAGGKHNDLDDVGKDTYHHTFFEMLGNWSFGDYFKKEAITWAWELLTDVWGLDKSRLHVTVFEGDKAQGLEPDDEARNLWTDLTDVPAEHIHWGNAKDNFWEMGDTGPCGPCSEIHYDATPDKSGAALVNGDDPRVIEIWNLVFIQFNRDASGQLSPLPAKHVDTGMGFERITAVLQGKTSNYDTDVFAPIFAAIEQVTGAAPYGGRMDETEAGKVDMAYRVIADHIRTLTIALTDGAHCGADGRSYVLRRILRRAVHFGANIMGVHEPFFYKLVPAVVDAMGQVFPELKKNPQAVADELKDEELAFRRTLDRGTDLFAQAADRGGKVITADDAFALYDTYGFPLDLTQVMAEQRGMSVDVAGFEKLMEQARQRSREAGGKVDATPRLLEIVQRDNPPPTEFIGYDALELAHDGWLHVYGAEVQPGDAGDQGGKGILDEAAVGRRVIIVTGKTPFYAEAGGQVADQGVIEVDAAGRIRIDDVQRVGQVIFHMGIVESAPIQSHRRGPRGPEAKLRLIVDADRRKPTMANHTATHILNRALRDLVNPEAAQKGSLVDPDRTRFDFSHNQAMTLEQIEQVEKQINDDIAADLPVYTGSAPQEQALKINGLRAVFGERYPDIVRIVSIGPKVDQLLAEPQSDAWANRSIEFCGGTHVAQTGDIEGFVIISEEPVARGVRRLTGITGAAAHQAQARAEALGARLEALKQADVKLLAEQLPDAIAAMQQETLPALAKASLQSQVAELQKTLKAHEKKQNKAAEGEVVDTARQIAEASEGDLIIAQVPGADGQTLRTAMDVIRKKRPDAAMLLAAADDQKIAFLAAVPKPMIDKGLKAGDWVREVAKAAGGGGGGRPDMAQAGGKDPAKLPEALDAARSFAADKLGQA